MKSQNRTPIRVLVADDEADVRDAYTQILLETDVSQEIAGFRELRSRLFKRAAAETQKSRSQARGPTFDPVFCEHAEAAVAAVK
ncbi:MAG TPA: hypothetical protein VFB37_04090, partial [Steroidobacteraceae bacterium]|nr:hypothetical protein [Steroidobacteraceae bacterium]